MANNYVESSSFLKLNDEQLKKAKEIIDRCEAELEQDKNEDWSTGGYVGVDSKIESDGVWFSGEESVNIDHMEYIAKALVEELNVEDPFFASWSYTCSKPRIDEFGGGAMCIMKGKDTIWVDAMYYVMKEADKIEREGEKNE